MPTPSIQTLVTDAQQVLNLDSISAVRSVVAVALANANTGTPLNPNLTTQQLWNEFYQVVNKPKSDIESIIANQLMKLLYAPPAPGGVGANGQVIFNDNGVLAGDSGLTFNPATDTLRAGLLIVPGNTQLATVGILYVGSLGSPKLKVDVAGTGETTIASATITGDLTVDTNTLYVNSTANRVGIVNASPAAALDIVGGKDSTNTIIGAPLSTVGGGAFANYSELLFKNTSGANSDASIRSYGNVWNAAGSQLAFFTSNNSAVTERYRIDNTGVATWSNVGGVAGTAMTLNSTGLGVGTTDTTNGRLNIRAGTAATGNSLFLQNLDGTYNAYLQIQHSSSGVKLYTNSSYGGDAGNLTIGCGGATNALIVNGSGNVGVGVTPNTWTTYKALQVQSASIFSTAGNDTAYASNLYYDSGYKYRSASSEKACKYEQFGGSHSWHYTASAGTAGNTAVLTQAMTLDASGNLLVGTTGLNATWNTRLTLSSDSGTTRWAVGPYSTATNFVISGASGGGVYLNGTAATSWTSASDERLKDIIEPIGNAVAKVGSLRAVIGKFKNDALNTRKSFLIAQDVQSVLPEAVDASNPDQLGVAYTDVIPLLVAAIKELTARVEALEA